MKKFKIFGLTVLAAVGALSLTSCGKKLKEAQANLNNAMKENLNTSTDMQGKKVDKYEFLGADFTLKGNEYSVDLSGVAKYGEGKSGYINAGLIVDEDALSSITKKTDTSKVYNIMTDLLKDYKFEYVEVLEVENIKQLSKSATSVIESPKDGYTYNRGTLYSISKPEINYDESYATFQGKSYLEVSYSYMQTYFIHNGNGLMPVTRRVTNYNYSTHVNNYYIKATQEELKQMEINPALVYSKYAENVENKLTKLYNVEAVSVEKANHFTEPSISNTSLDLN